jgi:hypothetical protein
LESEIVSHENGYAFWPHKVKGEGFFLAIGIKEGETKETKYGSAVLPKPFMLSFLNFKLLDDFYLSEIDKKLFMFNSSFQCYYDRLQGVMNVNNLGFPMTDIKGKDLVPSSFSAFLIPSVYDEPIAIDLNLDKAIRFLKKEDPGIELPHGFHLLTYLGVPLGWIKSIGTRNNNLFPSQYRILRSQVEGAIVLK